MDVGRGPWLLAPRLAPVQAYRARPGPLALCDKLDVLRNRCCRRPLDFEHLEVPLSLPLLDSVTLDLRSSHSASKAADGFSMSAVLAAGGGGEADCALTPSATPGAEATPSCRASTTTCPASSSVAMPGVAGEEHSRCVKWSALALEGGLSALIPSATLIETVLPLSDRVTVTTAPGGTLRRRTVAAVWARREEDVRVGSRVVGLAARGTRRAGPAMRSNIAQS